MANQTSINGSVSIGDPSTQQGTFTLSVSTVQTGSNITLDASTINSGSWVALQTASLSNMKWAVFSNQGSSSVQLGTTSAGGGFNPILAPGDVCILPLSGSGIANQQLWVRTITVNGSNLVQYGIQEA